MTTNLVEAMNSMLKKIRSLLVFALVNSTYEKCNKYFVKRGREDITMMILGKELAKHVHKIIEVEEKKANSMSVIEFDR